MSETINRPQLTGEEIKPAIFDTPEKYATPQAVEDLMKGVLAKRVDLEHPTPRPELLVSMGKAPIFRVGSLMFACGQAGSRKTSALTLMAADMIRPGLIPNSPFTITRPLKVLYIDPEQHPADTEFINDRVRRLIGSDEGIFTYPLVEYPTETIPLIVEQLVKYHRPDVTIMDNVAQMGSGVIMDIDRAEMLMRNLRRLAVTYSTAFVGVLHINETQDKAAKGKPRGHGGSEAVREADLVMRFVEDEGETFSQAEAVKARMLKPQKWGIAIDAEGLPYYHAIEIEAPKPKHNPDKYANIVALIPPTGISYTDLYRKMHKEADLTEATAKRWIKDMVTAKAIVSYNGLYYSPSNAPQKSEEDLPF